MMTLPRGCPRVELTLNEDRCTQRDLDALKSRRGERMIFEGAGQAARSRQVQAKGRPALTLFSCLVQPSGCNRDVKKAAQTKGRVNRFREQHKEEDKKSSTEIFCLLTFEAI